MKTTMRLILLGSLLGLSIQAGAGPVIGIWDHSDGDSGSGLGEAISSVDWLANSGIEGLNGADSCTVTTGLTGPVSGVVYRTSTRKLRLAFRTMPTFAGGASYTLTLAPIVVTTGVHPDYNNATNLANYSVNGDFNQKYQTPYFRFWDQDYLGQYSGCDSFPSWERSRIGLGKTVGTGANNSNQYLVAGRAYPGEYQYNSGTAVTDYDVSRYAVFVYDIPDVAISVNTSVPLVKSMVFVPNANGRPDTMLSGVGAFGFNALTGNMLRVGYSAEVTGGNKQTFFYYSLPTLTLIGSQSFIVATP